MANLEKIVKGADAVLNCIPIVNTVNCAAQALYRLAHKVDAHNPVAPGLKTSIKIHVLSQEKWRLVAMSLPIIGNMIALWELIKSIFHGFRDDLSTAVCQNNKELVRLCLANNALSDPERATRVLRLAGSASSNEVFNLILQDRKEWSSESLLEALGSCLIGEENANTILDYWEDHKLGYCDAQDGSRVLFNFLEYGKTDLADRVIGLLPETLPYASLEKILLNFSCAQYDGDNQVKKTGVLTRAQRLELIEMSEKPTLKQLKESYDCVGFLLKNGNTAADFRSVHLDTLRQLLHKAELSDREIGDFIASTLVYDELDFTEALVSEHEKRLPPESKMKILHGLLPSDRVKNEHHFRRCTLYVEWLLRKWRRDFSPAQAQELYARVSASCDRNIEVAKIRAEIPGAGIKEGFPTVEDLEAVAAVFKENLKIAFPRCDQAPVQAAG